MHYPFAQICDLELDPYSNSVTSLIEYLIPELSWPLRVCPAVEAKINVKDYLELPRQDVKGTLVVGT